MSSLSFTKFGTPSEVLKLSSAKIDLPNPTPGQVKVSIKASQVLPEDIRAIRGLSFLNRTVDTAGTTAVGVVTGVPCGESDFSVNDTVFVTGNGLWRNEAVVAKSRATKVAVSSDDAATLPSFVAAWGILHNFASLKAGDIVVQSSGDSAVGSAISQVGKALGLNVLSPTADELKDPKFVSSLKDRKNSIKLVVGDRSGRTALDLTRVVADGGVSVFYNGKIESLEENVGVDVPAASNIYKNVSVAGFDLGAWAAADAAGFRRAVTAVATLGAEKKVSLKPKVYSQAEYLKAVADVESNGAAAVIKF